MVGRALRQPRGRYGVERASQLSGIPVRTLHDWAATGTLVPDRSRSQPRGWSYRDLVFARLLAWLRTKHMARAAAGERVALLRKVLESDDVELAVRSDGTTFFVGDERVDRTTGQQAFDGVLGVLDVFELTAPTTDLGDRPVWAPSLVRPSAHTYISPWVAGGEPCLNGTKVPTLAVHGLVEHRGLTVTDIARLYDILTPEAISDGLALEARLRGVA